MLKLNMSRKDNIDRQSKLGKLNVPLIFPCMQFYESLANTFLF